VRRSLLIVRPQPGANKTAQAAQSMGLEAVVAPLLEVVPIAWQAPEPDGFDALMLTSANAVRHGGAELERLRTFPVYAVGETTAAAARDAGLTVQAVGDGDADALLALAARDGVTRLLHLAGREHRTAERDGVSIARRIAYASEAVPALSEAARGALAGGAIALLHSPRTATLFAALCRAASLARDAIMIAVLSDQVGAAAGDGWADVAVAAQPTDDALLAAAARLCDG
jgi:uroporphyrinogen-III synthase